ncbi:MAG: hypothetical protein ACI4V1_06075, partial [Eubacteriales bacterium]
ESFGFPGASPTRNRFLFWGMGFPAAKDAPPRRISRRIQLKCERPVVRSRSPGIIDRLAPSLRRITAGEGGFFTMNYIYIILLNKEKYDIIKYGKMSMRRERIEEKQKEFT